MGRALLVEESLDLRDTLSKYLTERGLDVYVARGPSDARALLTAIKPAITTLDPGFESGDDLSLIDDIHRAGSACVVVSSRGGLEDRKRALALGADDYVVKPFDLEEIYLRLRNILSQRAPGANASAQGVLDINGLKIDLVTRSLLCDMARQGPDLTESEISLLRILAENMGATVDKETLFAAISPRPFSPATRSLDVSVSRLRHKIKATDLPYELRSVREAGYMLSIARPRAASARYSAPFPTQR